MNNNDTIDRNTTSGGLARSIYRNSIQLVCAVLALALMGVATVASATDDEITRTHQISVQGQSRLMIENSVGKMDVRAHDGPEILLEVTLKAGRHGLLRRKVDISDVDISVEHNDRRIRLALQEDNVSADWVVHVPAFEHIELKLGVGEMHAEWLDSSLNLDVGVGDVSVYVDIDSLGEFSANVGVGDINADGIHNYSSSRRVVTESSTGRGRGEHGLDIEVGVGDIEVKADSRR